MRKIIVWVATAMLLELFGTIANASTITDNFVFKNSSNTVVANGSFSYDSALSGQLAYGDLSSFSVHLLLAGESYDLAYALANTSNYNYFGYNTISNDFVPTSISGRSGPYEGILAAISWNWSSGFFFDPLPSQNVANNDGIFAGYSSNVWDYAVSTTVTQANIPEPASLALLSLGLAGLGFSRRRRA